MQEENQVHKQPDQIDNLKARATKWIETHKGWLVLIVSVAFTAWTVIDQRETRRQITEKDQKVDILMDQLSQAEADRTHKIIDGYAYQASALKQVAVTWEDFGRDQSRKHRLTVAYAKQARLKLPLELQDVDDLPQTKTPVEIYEELRQMLVQTNIRPLKPQGEQQQ